jgi:osmotically inducible protein OsmC
MKRKANAVWNGSGKGGHGHLSTQSTVLHKTPYSFSTRFEDGVGTNPEELVAAAHAGCFSMKLAFVLNAAGLNADDIHTTCTITLENGAITESHLDVLVKVPGLRSNVKLQEYVGDAKANCPISKLYNTTITAEAKFG